MGERLCYTVKCGRQRWSKRPPGRGEVNAAVHAHEQGLADLFLQNANEAAYPGLGGANLFGSAREALQAGSRFEGPDGAEGGEPTVHSDHIRSCKKVTLGFVT